MAGRRGLFAGKVGIVPASTGSSTHPDYELLGDGHDGRVRPSDAAAFAPRSIPVYPATAQPAVVEDRQGGRGRCWTCSASCPTRCPTQIRCAARAGRTDGGVPPDPPARRRTTTSTRAPSRLRFEEAFVLQVAAGAAAPCRGARPAGDPAGGQRRTGCWPRSTTRLPFALTAGQREVGAVIAADLAPQPPDAPAAAGRGRVGQDARSRCGRCSPWSTPAARRRCWPPPRCWRSSTTARSPRCSGRWRSAGSSAATTRGTPVALLTGSQARRPGARRCSTSPTGDAGIVIGTHALLAGARGVLRPRAGRRRRAAPVRRRAARRACGPRARTRRTCW